MKVLVIDDNPIHQRAAEAQLKDHTTTVVGSYDDGQRLLKENGDYFDVVLVDLLMPASGQQIGFNTHLVGQEMPIGIFLALLAAVQGAKYVAVFTDSDHHSHPASACFDAIQRNETKPRPFRVEEAKFLLSNKRNWVEAFYLEDLSRVMPWDEYFKDKARAEQLTVRAKNWKALLDYLVG